ncbi:Secondary metabolism regulator laeA [Colletotrichum aenigma]|uniref:Secondary metabolism regulator laeA n=1 Tax=Colletotrichum aenigma TaxID=1215731 RepID=UPI001872ADC3|nr:Secondary metabolism regulator laeA [Colletotrichum aenigma]KAF5501994.1 Secondary metabolism regulator laeA [Colletotrichum aenigma]
MNSPPNSFHQVSPEHLTTHPASAFGDPLDHQNPGKRRKVDGPPSPEDYAPAAMSPPSSTDTAITVGSHNDEGRETESLSESVLEHMYEHRLRYHAYRAGKYAFPNDLVEQDRDFMKHLISNLLCDRWYLSPVDDVLARGGEVLDLGTGPGHWVLEVAEWFPDSTFLGIDLSPIQPSEVPPNVHFMVDDFEHENGWALDEEFYDFVHLRHTLHSVRDRMELMNRAYRHLKPGGWFEIQELEFSPLCDDGTTPEGDGYGFRVFTNYLEAGMRALGSEMHGIRYAADEMRLTGFESVHEDRRKCPIGDWAAKPELREAGGLMRRTIEDGLKGLATRPFRALQWTEVQIEIFLMNVRPHVANKGFHAYLNHRTVYGRKPLNAPRRA